MSDEVYIRGSGNFPTSMPVSIIESTPVPEVNDQKFTK